METVERHQMATSKKKKIAKQGAKTAFVRSLPRSLSAAEVQERAAAEGLTLSVAYIHNIRSAASQLSRTLEKGRKIVKGDKKVQEKAFRELVIALGPARCKKLLDQVEGALIAKAG